MGICGPTNVTPRVGQLWQTWNDGDRVWRVAAVYDYGPLPRRERKFKGMRRDRSVLLEPAGWAKKGVNGVRHRIITEKNLRLGMTDLVFIGAPRAART